MTEKQIMGKEELQQVVPREYRGFVSDKIVELINSEPEDTVRELFRENFIRYTDVIEGKSAIGVLNYVRAVKYCSLRLIGNSTVDSYMKVFPERCMGRREDQIKDSAGAYNKRKIVRSIMERSLVPVHILNADVHQEAINVQAELMRTAKSEMVRMKAAECLIQHLKQPEVQKVQVDVNHGSQALDELRAVTRQLAVQQKRSIEMKQVDVIDVAESELVGSGDEGANVQ